MTLKIGALFAGYGGLDLATEMVLPAQLAWVSEIETAPTKILAHHYPDVPNLGDITKIDWTQVEPVDIITGGSPCQDLSHAGRRAGMKTGTRSGLWASMCDAIETIKPRLVIWENVQGALSGEASIGDVESCEFCVDSAGGGQYAGTRSCSRRPGRNRVSRCMDRLTSCRHRCPTSPFPDLRPGLACYRRPRRGMGTRVVPNRQRNAGRGGINRR